MYTDDIFSGDDSLLDGTGIDLPDDDEVRCEDEEQEKRLALDPRAHERVACKASRDQADKYRKEGGNEAVEHV